MKQILEMETTVITNEKLAEGVKLAEEVMQAVHVSYAATLAIRARRGLLEECDLAFIAHWNPEFVLEVARHIEAQDAELVRLRRVEEAVNSDVVLRESVSRALGRIRRAALANLAAEEGDPVRCEPVGHRLVRHPDDCKCGKCIGLPRYGPAEE